MVREAVCALEGTSATTSIMPVETDSATISAKTLPPGKALAAKATTIVVEALMPGHVPSAL
jgi:hypothetical protein